MELGAHQAEEQPLPPLPTGSFWGLSSVFRDQGLGSVLDRTPSSVGGCGVWPMK